LTPFPALNCPDLEEQRRQLLARLVDFAIEAADPAAAVARGLCADELETSGRTVLIAAGKAAIPMAGSVLEVLGSRLTQGVVVFPCAIAPPKSGGSRLRFVPGSHPVPDEHSVAAAKAVAEAVTSLRTADRLVLALSGGATSLLAAPRPGLQLADIVELNKRLLRCGASIEQMNCVRRHVLSLGGGGLAQLAAPSQGIALLLSDVVGDDPAVIGSGPLCADPTTFSDALEVLRKLDLARALPAVQDFLERGSRGEIPETLKPGSALSAQFEHRLVGSGPMAASAVAKRAGQLGLVARVDPRPLVGDVEQAAERVAAMARVMSQDDTARPAVHILAGETTVSVTGSGKGGRNQELALRAAVHLAGLSDVAVLTLATDGVDGQCDAAGAAVTGSTVERAMRLGIDLGASLANNDSNVALKALDCLLCTGPTQTNVADLAFIARW
jgi:hydroxypyruvate reductase